MALAVLAVVLAGCDAGTVFYAEGVDLVTRDADLAICEAQALTDYPIRQEIRFTARVFRPAMRVCDAEGTCRTTPGYWEGGEPYTVDANAEARRTATRGCMGARGYARVGLPYCERGAVVRYSSVMPALGSETCLLRQPVGGPIIVNPVPPPR
jgi:hypothetical protein